MTPDRQPRCETCAWAGRGGRQGASRVRSRGGSRWDGMSWLETALGQPWAGLPSFLGQECSAQFLEEHPSPRPKASGFRGKTARAEALRAADWSCGRQSHHDESTPCDSVNVHVDAWPLTYSHVLLSCQRHRSMGVCACTAIVATTRVAMLSCRTQRGRSSHRIANIE